jgi:5-formyltetrahydrofolate cyclo-ligase
MDDTKAAIRHAMRRRRRALSPTDVAAAGAATCAAVLALGEWRAAPLLLAYFDSEHEVPTGALIASAHAAGKRVFLPRLADGVLHFAEHHLGDVPRPGAFGLAEPSGEPLAAGDLAQAIAVLPLVAWDDAGGRLGRGGGHYDRAFAGATRPSCLVGLAYAFQQHPRLPCDPWDVRLDLVVTDDGGCHRWTGEPRSPLSKEGEHHHGIPGDADRQPGHRGRAGRSDRRPATAAG